MTMEGRILQAIRKLNWVLSESTTGSLSYEDLCNILSEIINANVLITDKVGKVLGACYTNAEDSSTVADEQGVEMLTEFHKERFISIEKTIENLRGEESRDILGENYTMIQKYHCIIPSFCGGERMGTVVVARYDNYFDEVDIALCEYGATVVGIEIQRNLNLAKEEERRQRFAVEMAIHTLSYTERNALTKIFEEIKDDEGLLVVSKVAGKYSITNSVIVNALRKLESARVVQSRSLGMKGTHIKVTNPYFREIVDALEE